MYKTFVISSDLCMEWTCVRRLNSGQAHYTMLHDDDDDDDDNDGRRAFAISGPRIWNSLPDYLKDSDLSIDIFKHYLKTYFFRSLLTTRRFSAFETP